MAISALAAILALSLTSGIAGIQQLGKNVTPFPEKLFGTYSRKMGVPTKAILGPVAYNFLPSMNVLRDPETDDVWFTLLLGQMWHVQGSRTQYCFGPAATKQLSEQTPFSVESITDTSVNFCWRSGLRGMPTQKKGCMGCDCARILLNLTDPDTLHFQFWMSPPVLHADVMFVRSGKQATFQKAIESTMSTPYVQCGMHDHYGPNVPGEPSLTTAPPSTSKVSGGCAQSISETVAIQMKNDDLLQAGAESISKDNSAVCSQLNGVNLYLDNLAKFTQPKAVMGVSDVKVLFTTPPRPCDPCDVSYSVSAKTEADEYIAVGFKGRSWEKDFPYAPEHPLRPCYFGMCVDSFDNFTSDRIALGYTAGGGCLREMVSKNIVGAPVDADYKILKDTSVERVGGRTVLHFTVSQHWQWDDGLNKTDGPWRIMWAIGKVTPISGNDMLTPCAATIGYHAEHRGVAPLNWLSIGSTPCKFEDDETSNALPTLV
jgi:hypothetical protein